MIGGLKMDDKLDVEQGGRRRTTKWDSSHYQSELRGTRIKKVVDDGKADLRGGHKDRVLQRPPVGGT